MRYSDDQKLAVVLDYESGNDGQKVVARRHGVEATSLRNWVALYRAHGMDGIARRTIKPRFPLELKLEVLTRQEQDGLSQRQLAAMYGIRRHDVIGRWRHLYDAGGPAALVLPGRIAMPRAKPPEPRDKEKVPATTAELVKELQRVKAENAYLKKLGALVRSRSARRTGR